MSEGFMMDSWMAMLFFRLCGRYKINDLAGRTCLMRELVKRKRVKYLRDAQSALAGKRVLKIGFKKEPRR